MLSTGLRAVTITSAAVGGSRCADMSLLLGGVFLEPLDPGLYVGKRVAGPAVPAIVLRQVNGRPGLLQSLLGRLGHAERADSVVRRVVQVVGVSLRRLQVREPVRPEHG